MRNESPTVTLEIPKALECPRFQHAGRLIGQTCYGAHEALVPQPEVTVFIPCPCARCQQWREEYALAKKTFERHYRLAPLPDSLYPEAPTQQDRDVLDAIDVVAKIVVVLIFLAFIFICYHAYATHAVERMLSR